MTRNQHPRLLRFAAAAAVFSCCFFSLAEVPLRNADGFALPQPGRKFVFPRDHGSHPEFAIEWWYITGHLEDAPHHFGFQATFFRRSAEKPGAAPHAHSTGNFGHDQVYLAHMALVDLQSGQFRHQERINRAGWDASAATDTLDVRNGNWSLRLMDPEPGADPDVEVFDLRGTIGAEIAFQLSLTPLKPLVFFGADNVSRKAAEPSAASHYLTFTRMAVTGALKLPEKDLKVTGEAWMDHEFSSSQLGEGQVGWDWASIQLQDGNEIMAYRMRRTDGGTDPFSTLAWIDPSGAVRQQGPENFTWTSLSRWRSPVTGANYPTKVRVTTRNPWTAEPAVFILEPLVAHQEFIGNISGIAYWEGACRVTDENGREIGRAYMELTGYDGTLKGRF
jgi:predicted secreted hydrolase